MLFVRIFEDPEESFINMTLFCSSSGFCVDE